MKFVINMNLKNKNLQEIEMKHKTKQIKINK